MPPVSFGLFQVDGLNANGIATAQQTAILGADDEPATRVEYDGTWQHGIYQKFNVTHESRLHLEGRYHNEPINEVIQTHRFTLYKHVDSSLVVARGNKKLVREALHRLQRQTTSGFAYRTESLDLVALAPHVAAPIAGGWFGQLKIHKVNTVGIFGADVADSEEWERYEQSGTLQALIIEVEYNDEPMQLMVTREAIVVLYRDLGEIANLAFLDQIRALLTAASQAIAQTGQGEDG